MRKLLLSVVFVCSVAATSLFAQAIIPIPIGGLTNMPFTVDAYNISVYADLNGDEVWDIHAHGCLGCAGMNYAVEISASCTTRTEFVFEQESYDQKLISETPSYDYASILPYGTNIDDNLSYGDEAYIAASNDVGVDMKGDSYVDGKKEGYIAYRIPSFDQDADVKQIQPSYKYGWIHILIDEDAQSVTFLSQGIEENPDIPISAGKDDPYAKVPIPIFASILGFGIIGFTALRKRRK